jgi:predicted HD phosphohydrolase
MSDVEQVGFRSLKEGTQEDYARLAVFEERENALLGDRMLREVAQLTSTGGVAITRCEHALQTATRAFQDGRDEEYVVAALVHDVGELLAPHSHGEIAGTILRPFVRPEVCWIAEHHVMFQAFYYAHHSGGDRYARDRYRDHPHYQACVDFCEFYDQSSFDPDYPWLDLEFFAPMVRRVFAEPRYLPQSP